MIVKSARHWVFGAAALCVVAAAAPTAHAQDFFSQLFGGFGRSRMIRMPFDDGNAPPQVERRRYYGSDRQYSGGGGGQAYCVRTCDGRYFPIAASDNASRADICSNFCPASETKVVYGSNIDDAATENGRSYSDLPNAFRYRNEIVAGCTCNGKDPVGLASIKVEDDPTLRKGDIVAGENGLLVAGRRDRRGAELNFSPAPDRIRAKYSRSPVVAAE
jgi:Protein of unknown function (DUF2865)